MLDAVEFIEFIHKLVKQFLYGPNLVNETSPNCCHKIRTTLLSKILHLAQTLKNNPAPKVDKFSSSSSNCMQPICGI